MSQSGYSCVTVLGLRPMAGNVTCNLTPYKSKKRLNRIWQRRFAYFKVDSHSWR